jgi:nucleoside phosphorylase
MTCQQVGCQKSRLVQRKRLLEALADGVIPKPLVHFGFVGSGDTVMKSGQHRDLTAAQHNLIAFEMEASGIWDNLPCLVIKGVCDYADSHKNKHWQYYAAATAAACMKAVLEEC